MTADGGPVRWGILGTAGINRKFLAGARQASRGDSLGQARALDALRRSAASGAPVRL